MSNTERTLADLERARNRLGKTHRYYYYRQLAVGKIDKAIVSVQELLYHERDREEPRP